MRVTIFSILCSYSISVYSLHQTNFRNVRNVRVMERLNAFEKPISSKSFFASAFLSFSLLFTSFGGDNSAFAADTVKIGKCLLTSCQKELAQCILNPKCFANVICLNTCNNRDDESECQIKCGDLFENDVVGVFNNCAVSQKKCVPQRQSDHSYPLPSPASMVKKFDTSIWNGRWYISAGLNKAFGN